MNDAAKVAAVAGSLSGAMRKGVLGHILKDPLRTFVALRSRGLMTNGPIAGPDAALRLTPLGLLVRDLLRNQEGNGDA